MNLQMTHGGHDFGLSLPDRLVFIKFVLRSVLKSGVPDISREAEKRILAELKRIRQVRGSWVLVEVQSADGEQITITV